jgi:hypothetical protein
MQTIESLWDGEMPILEGMDGAFEFMNILINGLWNNLAEHQSRGRRFRLTPMKLGPTLDNLDLFASVRLEELQGFLDGLTMEGEVIDILPDRAEEAMEALMRMAGLLAAVCAFAATGAASAELEDIKATLKHLERLTLLMEAEMHEAVAACTRARLQADDLPGQGFTVH